MISVPFRDTARGLPDEIKHGTPIRLNGTKELLCGASETRETAGWFDEAKWDMKVFCVSYVCV